MPRTIITALTIALSLASGAVAQDKKGGGKLRQAYKREFAFLKAEKSTLEKRINALKGESSSKTSTARTEVDRLRGGIMSATMEAERLNEMMYDAERSVERIEEGTDAIERALEQATAMLEKYGIELPERQAAAPTGAGAGTEGEGKPAAEGEATAPSKTDATQGVDLELLDFAPRRLLDEHLRPEGFNPTFVSSAREGLALAGRGAFGLVLLHMLLQDIPGTEVVRQLKQSNHTREVPVVVVTTLDTEIDRIVAFELGAVDCVTEPFSVRELLLRLRVALTGKTAPSKPRAPARYGLLVLDFDTRRALVRNDEIALSPREFDLLAVLHARTGGVCSREQLREAIWADATVSLRTVDASVKRLRKKLGPARDAVETVRGVGYRFRSEDDRLKCA